MNESVPKYKAFLEKYLSLSKDLQVQYNWVSAFRFFAVVTVIGLIYFYFKLDRSILLILAGMSFVVFFILIKIHARISNKKRLHKELVNINSNEIDYLDKGTLGFEDGSEFLEPDHFYAYDLDVFGSKGLYQNLNRTSTFIGKRTLARKLLKHLPISEIESHQKAVQELTDKIEWRQKFTAIGHLIADKQSSYERLIQWSRSKVNSVKSFVNVLLFVLPIIAVTLLVVFIVTQDVQYRSYMTYFILANLFLLARHVKSINQELEDVGLQHQTLKNYSLLFKEVGEATFESEYLNGLKERLSSDGINASQRIHGLAKSINDLESMQNLFGAVVFNGLVLYHIHSYKRLLNWKRKHAKQIESWLSVIGEFEALNSFANLAYNNRDFIYPSMNTESIIDFENLGHPLINSDVRVDNSIDFTNQRFVILTGSNMSGKSTFLRTLGINMILAGAGAPICASKANVHPMSILVSMRLSDSLSENESYFFAEVKRLKAIMHELEEEQCFVLLDEILRGTNSDDKRAGTKAVIKKIISKNAIGIIATHDLEVCSVTDEYSDILTNKRFEVEIVNNELDFDYKLKDGICQNKNASFLMKKMGVI